MPRTPWRRRTIDSPRPAGRLAGGLRRGGSIARQVLLVRVAHRRGVAVGAGTVPGLDPAAGISPAPALDGLGNGELRVPGGRLLPDQTPGRRRRLIRSRRRSVYVDPAAATALTVPPASLNPGLSLEPALPGLPLEGALPAGTAPVTAPLPTPTGTAATDAAPVRVPAGTSAGTAGPVSLLPGAQTFGRKARFALANACTLGSVVLGMMAIFLTINGDLRVAALCLVGGVAFDGLDGALARRLGVSSPFGAQLDSMADMCTFGIATPVVVYAWLHGSAPVPAVALACALVAASAAVRLARFNVSPYDGRFFAGVPTTMAAAVLSVSTLIGVRLPGAVAVGAIVLVGLAMVSSFPYAKLSRIVKLPPWLWLLPVMGALLDYRVTFALVVLAYLVSGPLLWLHRRTAV